MSLDPRTVERIARLVVDIDGPQERHGREIEELLRRGGWPDIEEYDGSPRIPWLADQISRSSRDQAAVERLLCRLCDPLEYDGGAVVAETYRQQLNDILEPERLAISYHAGRPVLAKLRESDGPVFTAPPQIEQRLRALIPDRRVADVLIDRIAQSQASSDAGAHLLTLIGIGSFVEGVLYSVLTDRYPELLTSGFRDQHGRRIKSDRAGLAVLIDTAHAMGLIQLDAKTFLHDVRDFRNYIHPRHQMEMNFTPDSDTVRLCWAPVHAIINDLEQASPACNGELLKEEN